MNKNIFYRFQQFIIILLHLVLLKWMHFSLTEAGHLNFKEVLLHFIGMALYGAILIRGCAYWGRYHWLKEQKK